MDESRQLYVNAGRKTGQADLPVRMGQGTWGGLLLASAACPIQTLPQAYSAVSIFSSLPNCPRGKSPRPVWGES